MLKAVLVVIFFATIVKASKLDCKKLPKPDLILPCCDIPSNKDGLLQCTKEVDKFLHNNKMMKDFSPKDEFIIKALCMNKCEFEKNGFLNGTYDVNIEAVKHFYNNRYPDHPEYAELFIAGFEGCIDFARSQTEKVNAKMHLPCDIFATALHGCVYSHYTIHCPKNKWHATRKCEKLKSFMVECVEKRKLNHE